MEHVYVKLGCGAAKWCGYSIRGIRMDCVYRGEATRCIDDIDISSHHPAFADPEVLRQAETEHTHSVCDPTTPILPHISGTELKNSTYTLFFKNQNNPG